MKKLPDSKYKDWKMGDVGINTYGNVFMVEQHTVVWLVSDNGKDKDVDILSKPPLQKVLNHGCIYIGNIHDLLDVLLDKLELKRETSSS